MTEAPYGVTDDGEIYTQATVERAIKKLCDELEVMESDFVEMARDAKQTEGEFKLAFARARATRRLKPGTGPKDRVTVDEAEDYATEQCEGLFVDYLVKNAVYEATRDAMFTKRSRLSALQTISANIRAQT